MDLSLGFLFCSIDLYFCLCAVPYCLDDCGFVVEPEVRQVDSSSSVLLSQDRLGDLGSIPVWEDLLEKRMATHSSILAWRIPWTGEPGELQSMGLQRVIHD